MKVAIVTCYKDPDYIRARTLRTGLADHQGVEVLVLKNTARNFLRYPEVILQLIVLKFRDKPDAFMLTFRGYEILPFLLVVAWSKPVIFDEFVNPLEWLAEPGRAWWARLFPRKPLAWFYKKLINRCVVVLADTDAHAQYSSRLTGVEKAKFKSVPVSTDEQLFHLNPKTTERKNFQILYYGNMLPLHGLDYVLEAALRLKGNSHVRFLFIGGKEKTAKAVRSAQSQGARVEYKDWMPIEDLPAIVANSSLCLGGPFGKTVQASKVITGKTYQFLATGAPVLIGENEPSGLFENKVNCLSVPLGDPEALAESINWAYENRRQLPQIGSRGRALYDKYFSNKVVANKLRTIFSELSQD